MPNLIEVALEKFGLEEKEARVYLALLELGMEKVQAIAKRARLKRPTTYVILGQLYARNYVVKTFKNKKLYFSAERPETLINSLKEKEEALVEVLPTIKALMGSSKIRPKIKIYEGKGGIRQVYDEIYESSAADFFGSIKNLSSEFSGLTEKLIKIIRSQDNHVRDLITNDPQDIDFASAATGRNYESRLIPKEVDFFTDGAVYDNRVAILAIKKELFAVVIESEEIASTFRSIFNFLWNLSEPFDGKKPVNAEVLKSPN
ncbi:MAG: helix-turn-helix domain-containing protein [Candidatus Magasanikbacteria bacterium]|nr:helix-turn-helix domain-containing protein [Candidatus Magasanikbacteria bacterium]